jgi:hypothetical protein
MKDQTEINKIIAEASKGSKFYEACLLAVFAATSSEVRLEREEERPKAYGTNPKCSETKG